MSKLNVRGIILACAAFLVALPACKRKDNAAPLPGASLKAPPPSDTLKKPVSRDEADKRRLLYAQIVEDTDGKYVESAIIEGAPFKHFLKSLQDATHDQVRKLTNEQLTFDALHRQPGLYRGQVVTLARGVVLEVSQADLPPEYGLPHGYTVLPAVFVDAARDVYALRILCAPGSTLYEKLSTGIKNDALPVLRMSGYFMKLYARKTSDEKEPPWRRPLLVCPEPEFSQGAQPRKVWEELRDTHMDKLLPSLRIDAPGAEERMIVEVLPQGAIRIDGREAGGDLSKSMSDAVASFKKRLPEEQRPFPAAVILISPGASRNKMDDIVAALRGAGVQRLAVKSER
jgi:hypothetical protein